MPDKDTKTLRQAYLLQENLLTYLLYTVPSKGLKTKMM